MNNRSFDSGMSMNVCWVPPEPGVPFWEVGSGS